VNSLKSHFITDVSIYAEPVIKIVRDLQSQPMLDEKQLGALLRRHSRDYSGVFSKNLVIRTYRHLCDIGELEPDPALLQRLRMKPTRTISGVAPVTVLTKPYACPGKCIFCPTDVRMPKSYLSDEPGAMRAEQHEFDPFDQTHARIGTFRDNGHDVDKIELLILGGTWSSYPRDYQEWFVKRCFDAMNGKEADSLEQAQLWNESAQHRNVGLVIETRPDHIDSDEIVWLRNLGVTKVQLGAQSLHDDILELNKRGHKLADTRSAMQLLRAAGFKIVLHWMPNLLGSTPDIDRADYELLWSDVSLRPDEIKIYPCSLLANAELYEYWKRGEYQPYSDDTLIELVAACKLNTPAYCRINRVYRDIPAPNIVVGSTLSNLRQVVQKKLQERGQRCGCIRCREVRGLDVRSEKLVLDDLVYKSISSEEHFLSYNTQNDYLAGYLRLSLPRTDSDLNIVEIKGAALVRELHVYGSALPIGENAIGRKTAQHRGLGKRLMYDAEQVVVASGFNSMAVIASVGTREYYRARGYKLSGTYMVKRLDENREK